MELIKTYETNFHFNQTLKYDDALIIVMRISRLLNKKSIGLFVSVIFIYIF